MKINYEAIIEKANTRKDRLVAIDDHLSNANHWLVQLEMLTDWMGALNDEWRYLDQEGRNMLPPVTKTFLDSLIQQIDSLKRMRREMVVGGRVIGLAAVVEEYES